MRIGRDQVEALGRSAEGQFRERVAGHLGTLHMSGVGISGDLDSALTSASALGLSRQDSVATFVSFQQVFGAGFLDDPDVALSMRGDRAAADGRLMTLVDRLSPQALERIERSSAAPDGTPLSAKTVRDRARAAFPPTGVGGAASDCTSHWIAIEIRPDGDGAEPEPEPEPFDAILTDRSESGMLAGGRRRWDDLPAGICEFRFPEYHRRGPVPTLSL